MNANNIESKFAAMGARIKVHEIASRWRQGDRAWVSPADFAVDNRLPHEAGLQLLNEPRAPKELPVSALLRKAHGIAEWKLFLNE